MAAPYMLLCFAVMSLCVPAETFTTIYTMDNFCGETLDMSNRYLHSFKLRLTYASEYRSNMDCKMSVKAAWGQRLSFKFLDMDIANIFGCDDYLEIRDGSSTSSSLLGSRMCGDSIPPSLSTSGRNALLRFKSNSYKEDDGFTILVTSYNMEVFCSGDEFTCNNGRCISYSLYCNSDDNCGDNSDACEMDTTWWIWMIVGLVAFFILLAIIITVICCCCCCRKRPTSGTVLKTTTTVNYNAGSEAVTTNPWYGNTNNQVMTQPMNPAPPSYTAASGVPAGYPQPTAYQPVAYPPPAGPEGWQSPPPNAPPQNAPPPYSQKGENNY
ncbi:low-density lipoprotein receptor class A domain-containing protein 2-like [Haliotis cracherodii]|uniref:low-density lipoprotein receptor class A domain-containing protein 2-like n=1 Tax=Haliotis cracherodii TaxID=6455 RepID=UPI0039EC54F7